MGSFATPTLDALATLIAARPGATFTLVPAFTPRTLLDERPCPQGIADSTFCYARDSYGEEDRQQHATSIGMRLGDGWVLCSHQHNSTDPYQDHDLSAVQRPASKPRVWGARTMERLYTLLREAECYTFTLVPKADHTPKGKRQASGHTSPAYEWVDQGGGGISGDDFHGSITWTINGYYLIGLY